MPFLAATGAGEAAWLAPATTNHAETKQDLSVRMRQV
jgi:hypothetical protein